jgi:hypothetical protein
MTTATVTPTLDTPTQAAQAASQSDVKQPSFDIAKLIHLLETELTQTLTINPNANTHAIIERIAIEVDRICEKSARIQASGEITNWRLTLARYRLDKCVHYHQLGSTRGRNELHSTLSTMVYRPIAPAHLQLSFQGRYTLIEDFLQGFYTESLRAFRRENLLAENYQPKTKLQLAEYMAFTEQYAKRRINLPGCHSQQLVILRAQRFAKRQPNEITVDIETAMDSARDNESESYGSAPILQMIREQMVAEGGSDVPEDGLRDRIIDELVSYLKLQQQQDCIDYLTLKLQDLSVTEIDEILGLTSRQRDYLQQRFKYHVEKFAMSQNWKLVHEWLGADLDHNLGMNSHMWHEFCTNLTPDQKQLIDLKQQGSDDTYISKSLRCTTKQVQKRWTKILEAAWQVRNQ